MPEPFYSASAGREIRPGELVTVRTDEGRSEPVTFLGLEHPPGSAIPYVTFRRADGYVAREPWLDVRDLEPAPGISRGEELANRAYLAAAGTDRAMPGTARRG